MKKILRIVITGGPCGGKTSALNGIADMLENEGYTVIICHETATGIINARITPKGNENVGTLTLRDFQKLILDEQYAKEEVRLEAAQKTDNDKVVVIFDRGILDNRAYIPFEEFEELCRDKGVTEKEIMERYDLVIHMVSCAKDKPESYNLESNEARMEGIEEARIVESNTERAWYNFPNRYIVENDCTFEEKIERVKDIVRSCIVEKERKKYKVKKYNLNGLITVITKGFIERKNETSVRYALNIDNNIMNFDIYNDGSYDMYIELDEDVALPDWIYDYSEVIDDKKMALTKTLK